MSVLTEGERKEGEEGEGGRERTGHFYTFKGIVKGVEVPYEKAVKAALLCLSQRRP